MNTAAVPGSKVTAVADDNSFEELKVRTGIIPTCEGRIIRIGNIKNENAAAIETAKHGNVPVRVEVGIFQRRRGCTGRNGLRPELDLLSE